MTIQVPGYTIHKLLGEGGMASVYLATQQSLDRLVALKVLKKFDTEAQAQRFFNEGKIIASLNQRNIITIYDLGEVNGRCFFAMEYLEGGDLKQRLEAGVTPGDAFRLVKLIANCLKFVHQKDIIHRDIKPENILFRKDGSPVLTDFGVAKQLQTDNSLTMDGSAIGSPHYLSPEQAEQKAIDARTDIYSLGVIFYEMLTGRKPFDGASPMEIIIAHLTTEAALLPKGLTQYQELLDLMIAKDANDRFESAIDLIDYLESFQNPGFKQRRKHKRKVGKVESKAPQKKMPSIKFAAKPVGFGVAAAIALSVAGYYYPYDVSSSSIVAHSGQIKIQASVEEEPLAEDDQEKVYELLAKADLLLDGEEISLQVLEQAYGSYAHVLRIDSKNGSALKGISRIASLVVSIQQQIDINLAEADKAIQDFRLTSPKNNNAMFYFQTVLNLDVDNAEAKQGRFDVASAYADLVESNLQDFKYSKAETNLNKGLSIDPTSPRLLALKEQTNAFTDAPKRFFGNLKSFFD